MQNVFDEFEGKRIARKNKNSNEVEFVKQVSQHSRDRLARKNKR